MQTADGPGLSPLGSAEMDEVFARTDFYAGLDTEEELG